MKIRQIKQSVTPSIIHFAIEEDKRKVKHVHIISNLTKIDLTVAVENVLYRYLEPSDVKLLISPINNKYSARQYLGKAPLVSGII